ncbi:hypothetical protein EJ04DRAFT_590662 [Polyplosphaeria fusca]|uniref:Uncharacterized protein n=1 Tax=Polyplosphaeria fusca TaxID=682080 RepID=A0A9P4R705_9PLEO|nr:hypothetical protein EJ04DRAFT_590662 [Polyplosphaeria fusca]
MPSSEKRKKRRREMEEAKCRIMQKIIHRLRWIDERRRGLYYYIECGRSHLRESPGGRNMAKLHTALILHFEAFLPTLKDREDEFRTELNGVYRDQIPNLEVFVDLAGGVFDDDWKRMTDMLLEKLQEIDPETAKRWVEAVKTGLIRRSISQAISDRRCVGIWTWEELSCDRAKQSRNGSTQQPPTQVRMLSKYVAAAAAVLQTLDVFISPEFHSSRFVSTVHSTFVPIQSILLEYASPATMVGYAVQAPYSLFTDPGQHQSSQGDTLSALDASWKAEFIQRTIGLMTAMRGFSEQLRTAVEFNKQNFPNVDNHPHVHFLMLSYQRDISTLAQREAELTNELIKEIASKGRMKAQVWEEYMRSMNQAYHNLVEDGINERANYAIMFSEDLKRKAWIEQPEPDVKRVVAGHE